MLPAFQATIQNDTGDIIPSAVMTILLESTGLPAVIFSDRAGTIPLGTLGVFSAAVNGFAQFYAAPGEYRVTAEDSGSGFTQTWRYVAMADKSALVAHSIDSVADIAGLVGGADGQQISLVGWHPGSNVGGDVLVWDSAKLKSEHNGGTIFSPTVPWTVTTADYLNAVGETDGAGVGCWVRLKKQKYSAYDFGAKFDGATDDQLAIMGAVAASSRARLPAGITDSSTITLLEGQGLIGEFASIPSTGLGTILKYSGVSDVIHVDGAFAGFDSRRFMEFKDFSIDYLGTGINSMLMEFLSLFNIENIICYGNPDYHFNMSSSYNGTIRRGRLSGAAIANLLFTVNPADTVFSGQTLIEDFDFWGATNGTNDAAGTIVEAPVNIMEQLQFNKCHWQSNDYGLWVKSGSGITLVAAHLEGNHENDVRVDSGAQNPKILSGFCNNPDTITESMFLDGLGGSVNSFKFVQLDNGAAAIRTGVNSIGVVIEDVTVRQNDGATCKGIVVEGTGTTISNLNGQKGGAAGAFPLVTLEATAKNVTIKGLTYDNFTGSGRVVDNGAENVVFEDARLIESPVFTLDGGVQESTHYMGESGFINRIWFVYPAGSGAGTTTSINVGRSVSEGTSDLTRFAAETSAVNAGIFKRQQITAITNSFVAAGDVIIIRTAGSSSTAGNVQVIVEVTPYAALT